MRGMLWWDGAAERERDHCTGPASTAARVRVSSRRVPSAWRNLSALKMPSSGLESEYDRLLAENDKLTRGARRRVPGAGRQERRMSRVGPPIIGLAQIDQGVHFSFWVSSLLELGLLIYTHCNYIIISIICTVCIEWSIVEYKHSHLIGDMPLL